MSTIIDMIRREKLIEHLIKEEEEGPDGVFDMAHAMQEANVTLEDVLAMYDFIAHNLPIIQQFHRGEGN